MVNTTRRKRPFTSEGDRILNTSTIVNHFLAAASAGRRGRANVDERPSREILEGRNFLSRGVSRAFFRDEIFLSFRSRIPYLRAAHLLPLAAIHEKWCTRGVSCLVTLSKIESFIHGESKDCRGRETPLQITDSRLRLDAIFSWRMFVLEIQH